MKSGFLRYKGIYMMLICLSLCLSGCQKAQAAQPPAQEQPGQTAAEPEPVVDPAPEPESRLPVYLDPLIGLPVAEEVLHTLPIGVMINNYHRALPQYGIGNAGILYECEVEGGITRLLAIFNNYGDIPQIGPVRSARDYFIDLAYNHGAFYIHYGGSPQAYQKIKDYKVKDMDGIGALDSVMFWRDKQRLAMGSYMIEHSVFTSGEKILDGMAFKGYKVRLDTEQPPAFDFAESDYIPKGEPAGRVTIPYSNYISPVYTYDKDQGLYLRSEFDKPHIDEASGSQLSFKNLIILYADQKLIKGDAAGRLTLTTTGSIGGFYITNGAAVPIVCVKEKITGKAAYYTADGKPLLVNPGKTMINFVSDREPAVIEP